MPEKRDHAVKQRAYPHDPSSVNGSVGKAAIRARQTVALIVSAVLAAVAILVGTGQPATAGSGTVAGNCGNFTLTWWRDLTPRRLGYANLVMIVYPTAEYASRINGQPISSTIRWQNQLSGAAGTENLTGTVNLSAEGGYSLSREVHTGGNGWLKAEGSATINLSDGSSCWTPISPIATAYIIGRGPYTVRHEGETPDQARARVKQAAIDEYVSLAQLVTAARAGFRCNRYSDWPEDYGSGYYYHYVYGFCE